MHCTLCQLDEILFDKASAVPALLASLTHWGRLTHICVGNLTIIGSDNGLSPGRRQAITWTNVGILLIGPLGTNFSEILIEIHTFSFKKIHLKMSSGKWWPFCLGLNVLKSELRLKFGDESFILENCLLWMKFYIMYQFWNGDICSYHYTSIPNYHQWEAGTWLKFWTQIIYTCICVWIIFLIYGHNFK